MSIYSNVTQEGLNKLNQLAEQQKEQQTTKTKKQNFKTNSR